MSVVLITGCSSGFGMAMAVRLSASHHVVYATMRDLAKKRDLLDAVKRRSGKVRLLPLDVTQDTTIREAVARIEAETGRLDVVINNAGFALAGFFEDLTDEEIRDQMETNFFGVQNVTRLVLPLMRAAARGDPARGGSKIINISSGQGRSPLPALSAYASSKGALEAFSESLAFELDPFGIHVVVVRPGAFMTKIFTENARRGDAASREDSPYAAYTRRFEDYISEMIRSKRHMGDPEDLAVLIERIVNDPHPRFSYTIGGRTRLRILARRILPFSWFRQLVKNRLFKQVRGT